jgi:hypothetical protein
MAYYRTQLHHTTDNRSIFPPTRILYPQRCSPLMPHSLPTTTSHSPRRIIKPPSTSITRICPLNLRTRWHTATLPPTHLNPSQHSPPQRAKTPCPSSRLRSHRFWRRILDVSPLSHNWPGSPYQKTCHWRSITITTECEMVS